VGGAGVGKSRYVKRLSEALKVPFRTLSAAGSSDAMSIRGTAKGWASARPSSLIQFMLQSLQANGLVCVEEIDKTATSKHNGSLLDALLLLLTPESAYWFDEALECSVDLSYLNVIATSNSLGGLPTPLFDRFDIVHVPPPSKEHYPGLIDSVLRDIATEFKLPDPRLLPQLEHEEREHLVGNCGNARQLARAVRRLLEEKIASPSPSRRYAQRVH
jgi:ATP-dependent Lon protease